MMHNNYKKRYHPFIILMYVSGMLDERQKQQIPKTTRWNWNQFEHEDYYLSEWASNYIDQFESIKEVYSSSFLFKSLRFMIAARKGYQTMLHNVVHNKEIIKKQKKQVLESIKHITIFLKVSVSVACKFYGVSKDWYYRENRKLNCAVSPLRNCYKQYPNQLTLIEVSAIEKIMSAPSNFGKTKTTLYYQSLREDILFCAKSTFCKYATIMGYKKPLRYKPKPRLGFRASSVFEWLHVDITIVPTQDDGMQKTAFVKDNYSKAILHFKTTSGKAGSGFIKTLFQETFEKHRLFDVVKPIHILSDGGPENKGLFLDWVKHIKAPPAVYKITARSNGFPFSNNMSESTHSIFKTEFLKRKITANAQTHLQDLKRFYHYYNFERYPTELYGLTPMEVVQGKKPDKGKFSKQIKQARKDRIENNRDFNECRLVLGC